ncbi:hypothetical protein LJC63_07285 [Ruminococcaceae bacterium OttesenSCG-928-L11]|nr:hypothetical protein [Ruminococcaceae bacterium OttesenSCG-928-L11]
MKARQWLALALAVCMALCGNMALAAEESLDNNKSKETANYDEIKEVFSRQNAPTRDKYNPNLLAPSDTIDDYAKREIEKNMTIGKGPTVNMTVPNFVLLVVKEKKTLTVEKGGTLIVNGSIENYGTIVNNGTIILRRPKGETQVGYEFPILQLINRGIIENNGTILLECGEIRNNGGNVKNTGAITVANKDKTLTGIVNTKYTGFNKTVYATLHNTGTITIEGEEGVGLVNKSGSTLTNDGEILCGSANQIKGTVKNNQPIIVVECK